MSNGSANRHELKARGIQGVMWTVGQTIGARGITLIILGVLARLLEPDAFGLIALAMVFVQGFKALLNAGFAEAIVQQNDLSEEQLSSVFWLVCGLGGFAAGLCALWASELSHMVGQPAMGPVLSVLAVAVLLNSLSTVQEGLIRRNMRFNLLARRGLGATLAGGLAAVTFAAAGGGVWSLVAQQIVSEGTSLVLLSTGASWRPRFFYSTREVLPLFRFGKHILGTNLLGVVNRQADRLVIGWTLGPIALGYYFGAVRLVEFGEQMVMQSIGTVAFSVLAKLRGNAEELRSVFVRILEVSFLAIVPAFVILALAGTEVVAVLYGAKWTPSGELVGILAVAGLLRTMANYGNPMWKAMGAPAWVLRLTAMRVAIGIPLLLAGARWGLVAMCWALVFREALLLPLSMVFLKRASGLGARCLMQASAGAFLAGGVAGMAVVGAAHALDHTPHVMWLLGLEVGAGLGAYILTALLLCKESVKRGIRLFGSDKRPRGPLASGSSGS